MTSIRFVRARQGGTCAAEFFHPSTIAPGDITRVTTYFPGDEAVNSFGVSALSRARVCQWCVVSDSISDAQRHESGLLQFRDRQGDMWAFGPDGLLHTRETQPFSFEHVQRKWGPLKVIDPHTSSRRPPAVECINFGRKDPVPAGKESDCAHV